MPPKFPGLTNYKPKGGAAKKNQAGSQRKVAKKKQPTAPTTVQANQQTDHRILNLLNDINDKLDDKLEKSVEDAIDEIADHTHTLAYNIQTEFQQADAATKYDLRPGELSDAANQAMLVVPTGKPPLAHGTYHIGYDKEIPGWNGEWKFLSDGCPGSERWTAHARLLYRADANVVVPSRHQLRASWVNQLRQASLVLRNDDGETAGIVIVWVPSSKKKGGKNQNENEIIAAVENGESTENPANARTQEAKKPEKAKPKPNGGRKRKTPPDQEGGEDDMEVVDEGGPGKKSRGKGKKGKKPKKDKSPSIGPEMSPETSSKAFIRNTRNARGEPGKDYTMAGALGGAETASAVNNGGVEIEEGEGGDDQEGPQNVEGSGNAGEENEGEGEKESDDDDDEDEDDEQNKPDQSDEDDSDDNNDGRPEGGSGAAGPSSNRVDPASHPPAITQTLDHPKDLLPTNPTNATAMAEVVPANLGTLTRG